VVTLYIEDASLKLLVAKGKRVTKWSELPLEPGLVVDGVVVDEAKVAAKIKELLKAQRVKTKKAVCGLSGLRCLTRPITLPRLTRTELAEAITWEAERILPVPLDQLYLSWQLTPTSGEERQAFLVGLPRNAADALVRTVRQAGVDPYLMDIAPLALARAVDAATAIVIDVAPTKLDIVIKADGIPQPVRTISLPREAQPWQEKLPVVKEELDRTIKFYNSSYPEKSLAPDMPVLVSGDLVQEVLTWESLAEELGRPVLPSLPPLKCPQGLPTSQFMVNMGLALNNLSPGRRGDRSLVNLNTLPDVYRPKPLSLAKIATVPGIVAAVGLIVFLAITVQESAASTASLRTELDSTTLLLEQRHQIQLKQKEETAELERQVAGLEASYDAFANVLDGFIRQQAGVNGDLDAVTSALPHAIELSGIARKDTGLAVNGLSPSETEVLDYASNLRDSGRFSQVIVSTMVKTESGFSFTLILDRS